MIIDSDPQTSAKSREVPFNPYLEAPVQTRPPVSSSGGTSTALDDLPPPYVGRVEATSHGDQQHGIPQLAGSHLQMTAQQEVNHIELDVKHSPISGSYILNTELPSSQPSYSCRRHQTRTLDRNNRKLLVLARDTTPNASVHTRNGTITLNISTAGQTEVVSRAHVQVSSRNGKAHVNVHSLQANKHICLEVDTRHSNIIVFVPPNFQGAMQFRTRRGNIKFLPEFERWARLINASDHGAMVLFGQDLQSTVDWNDPTRDSCLLSTRHGKIIVGVSGVDHYEDVDGPGLLETLGTISTLLLGMDVPLKIRDEVKSFNARLQQRQQAR